MHSKNASEDLSAEITNLFCHTEQLPLLTEPFFVPSPTENQLASHERPNKLGDHPLCFLSQLCISYSKETNPKNIVRV